MGDEREGLQEALETLRTCVTLTVSEKNGHAALDVVEARVGQLTQDNERLLAMIGELAGFGSETYKRAERGGCLG